MKSEDIIKGITDFVNQKLAELSTQNPIINIFRPVIARGVNNNLGRLDSVLKLIQDADGNVDVENILGEMVDNLVVSKVQKYPDVLNGVEIGEGHIKIGLPIINKSIILDSADIEEFKSQLIKKQ